jgi:hypothetical protein
MKRTLIACAVIACAAAVGVAVAASPEVDKAIKTIQSATADPAKLKLFCSVADDDDEDNAADAKAGAKPEAKEEKADPAEEKAEADALKQLGADVAAALAVGEKLAEDSPDATAFATAMEAITAKCAE